ncbi:MAG TPA: pyridoxamine 5'-phosphate oxidase family protein [Bacteroidales bacterium]|nr:pyridoxamine 5'-phosphate oxidase family protein [Bacteroidales bacterium]HRZ48470.1 pyridoxamine 5'-phosphate oxidase family protein [Bacteroidales bacterium]
MRKTSFNDAKRISDVISRCQVCYMGMTDEQGLPYVLPFNFGYEEGVIYLHSAGTGKKIDILRKKPDVCIAFSTDHQLRFVNEGVACSYGMKFRSVLAYGKVVFMEDPEEKKRILNLIMQHYTGRDDFAYNMPAVMDVAVYKIVVSEFTGKESGF